MYSAEQSLRDTEVPAGHRSVRNGRDIEMAQTGQLLSPGGRGAIDRYVVLLALLCPAYARRWLEYFRSGMWW
jgi:hypothetical protein